MKKRHKQNEKHFSVLTLQTRFSANAIVLQVDGGAVAAAGPLTALWRRVKALCGTHLTRDRTQYGHRHAIVRVVQTAEARRTPTFALIHIDVAHVAVDLKLATAPSEAHCIY